MKSKKPETVNEYISSFPKSTQKILKEIRVTIKKAAPKAVEQISYGMPAYSYLGRPLVYFGGYEHHVGFYATPTGHTAFKEELSKYKEGKGSVQFPLDEKIPLSLIAKIVKFRVKENEERAKKKPAKKSAKKK